ncbi:hypothetical protein B296_00043379 [Ensete ventricosum]|uniref:Uncharacterized protein n=1 Tax=Ensete ventricosum TaxID=4639 RepID=A0A426XKY5_ENSVE|nr:hypothetical protein B296_00043379 [Ensete ventricosum]
MTPSRRRRSEPRNEQEPLAAAGAEEEDEEYVTEGARESWPRTQLPHPSLRGPPPSSGASPSGPSMSGARASPTGRKLADLAISGASGTCASACCWCPPPMCPFLRRGRSSSAADGDWLLGAGLLALDRAGDSPRTTPSSAEKNPCFFSMGSMPQTPSPSQTCPLPIACTNSVKQAARWRDRNVNYIPSRTRAVTTATPLHSTPLRALRRRAI